MWRRKLDDMKAKTTKKSEHLQGIQDKLTELEKKEQINDKGIKKGEGDNQQRNIRMLENKLDKAMIKYNEAISIKKSYDIILKKLREERIVYDKQLESMETQLSTKKKEFDEMLLLSHDANHAKEMMENDL